MSWIYDALGDAINLAHATRLIVNELSYEDSSSNPRPARDDEPSHGVLAEVDGEMLSLFEGSEEACYIRLSKILNKLPRVQL